MPFPWSKRLGVALLLLLAGCADEEGDELRLWTMDTSSRTLLALTPTTSGCDDFGYQDRPLVCLAVSDIERIYAIDQSSNELVRLNPWGGGSTRIGDVVNLEFPQSLALAHDGSLFLLDNNRTLIRLNSETAARIQQWDITGGLYASLCFSPVSFQSPTRIQVSAGDLLALRQEAGNSWLVRLGRSGTVVEVQDLARLPMLASFCGSTRDGRFYALDGTRELQLLDPETGTLTSLYTAECALENGGPLSTP
jgi:hypothetical protein